MFTSGLPRRTNANFHTSAEAALREALARVHQTSSATSQANGQTSVAKMDQAVKLIEQAQKLVYDWTDEQLEKGVR